MKIILKSHYRGPYRSISGSTLKVFDLPAGENDLSPDEVAYIRRDAPEIIVESPVTVKEVSVPPVNRMAKVTVTKGK